MKMLVRDADFKEYIIKPEDLIHGYWFNNDHSFDCFFNDLEDYHEWKKYCETDDDTYRILDEYIQDKGKDFGALPCEEALSINELAELCETFKYHWNSYNDTVTEISEICDLSYYFTSKLSVGAVEVSYFMKWNEAHQYNKQVYVDVLNNGLCNDVKLGDEIIDLTHD